MGLSFFLKRATLSLSLFIISYCVCPAAVFAQTLSAADRAQLEAQLAQVQAEQAQAQSALVTAQAKSSSLQNDIDLLSFKIKAEQLDIQAKALLIRTLGNNISTKQSEINVLDARINKNKRAVSEMFRQIQQTEQTTIVEYILANKSLYDFFNTISALETLQKKVDDLSEQLSVDEASTSAAKDALVVRQNAAKDAQYAIQQEQKTVQSNQAKQKQLLSISKGNEKSYSTLVAQKKKEAAAIKARLFALAGSNPIPFGQAYQYALAAQKSTGIDPAFLLAVMTQESNLGQNVGTCYLANTSTGSGVSVKSGKAFSNVMNPTRDVPPYIKITAAIGADPLHTVVSCPQAIGWGGAMGPAQFIASTWMLFTNRIMSALGLSGIANPWDPQHAFMASALYLSDLGAASGGYTAQSNAACKYYSGSSCSKSSFIASYGISVMSLTSKIQTTEIDKL